jgi:histidinol-phosphatase
MTAATDSSGVPERLAAAIEAARAAGAETLRRFQDADLTVSHKHDRSPVTEVDLAAENILKRHLLGAFPSDAFLGEETGAQPGSSGYEWVVDPIDGTQSFIRGVPLYATLVGCRFVADGQHPEAGRCLIGVIAIPALDELAYAAVGHGAWHIRGSGPPMAAQVSAQPTLATGLACSSDFGSFRRRRGSGEPARGESARRSLEDACRITRTWGDGYGYLLVATGRAEAMVDPLLNAWDAAAVSVVVEEAGGRFTDWRGQPGVDGGDGVATNGRVHAEILALLAAADR